MYRRAALGTLLLAALVIGCPIFLAASSSSTEAKSLRHVVLIKFKDASTPKDVKQVVSAFQALPSKIDTIKGFEWGTDVSVENKAQGFTHCFLVTFDDAKGRDVYLPHAAHKEFVNLAVPHIDKVLVFDYVASP
jgi:hypothetical protein